MLSKPLALWAAAMRLAFWAFAFLVLPEAFLAAATLLNPSADLAMR